MRKPYEMVFIVRPDLDETQARAAVERVVARIAERGGEVCSVEPWGKRRLAYPIQKHREGYYVLVRFQLEGQRVQDLKSAVALQEDVIRFLVCEAVPVAPSQPPVAASAEQLEPVPSGGGEEGC